MGPVLSAPFPLRWGVSHGAYAGPELCTSRLTGVQPLSQGQALFDLLYIDTETFVTAVLDVLNRLSHRWEGGPTGVLSEVTELVHLDWVRQGEVRMRGPSPQLP